MTDFLQYRFVPVVILLVLAAVLLTGKDRLPIALRGLRRALGGSAPSGREVPVSRARRLLAFALVLAAFLLAVI